MRTKLFFFFVALFTISLFAQDRGNFDPAQMQQRMKERQEQRIKAITDSCKLDLKQVEKIKEIIENQAKEQQKLREEARQGGGDREAEMAKRQELTKAANDKIKALLKDDQKKKFDEFIKKEEAERGNRRRGVN